MRTAFVARALAAIAGVALVVASGASAVAQINFNQPVAGVEVDANGVLRMKSVVDPQLMRQRVLAARAGLAPDLARRSESRKVSVNRLEAALAKAGNIATDEMKALAGLTRVRHVYYFPETKDIVLEGPAEGFVPDPSGRMIGIHSGRSILELQDLIVALRAFPPSGGGANVISVSIDPTPEGLKAMQQFLVRISGRVQPGDANNIAAGLKESLGQQVVSIRGIAPRTHFAQVLVEADYRMKLIGIGLEQPPVKIESYVAKANPRDVARNAMERWYFTPNYDCVKVSEDRLAMELVGDGVKLIGENERVNADGGRVDAGGGNRASQAFVRQFTEKYGELAAKSPVYAQLRNLIDLAVAAAYIQQQDFYGQSGWRMEVFGDEQAFAVETYNVPQQVESAVNVVWKGNTLMTPIGGGVNIQAKQALSPGNLQTDDGKLAEQRATVKLDRLAEGQWWWD